MNRQTPIQSLLEKASQSNSANRRGYFLPSRNEGKANLDENTREGILKALTVYADQLYTKLGP